MSKTHLSLLAFDFGTRQIGVATGQTATNSASPLTVLKARDGVPDWNQLAQLIEEWQPNAALVGMPLNMDGTESELCQRVRKFANRLHGRFGLDVHLVDERLSTFDAKQNAEHRASYRDNPIDAEAAALILQSWLDDPASEIPQR
ncbi:MAG: Holliday junction resolvase RuvX [bacterium]